MKTSLQAYENTILPLFPHGSMAIHGNPWQSMAIHGNPWQSMAIHGPRLAEIRGIFPGATAATWPVN